MLPTRRRWAVIYFFMFALLTSQGLAQDSRLAQDSQLAWKFAEGDEFRIVMDQTSEVETAVDRRVVSRETEMQLVIDWSVQQVDADGTARIQQSIEGVQLKMTMPGSDGPKTVFYDSASEEPPSGDAERIAASYACLLEQPIYASITARGEIADIEIPDETLESLRKMPGSMEGRESLTLQSVRDMFRNATVVFPDHAVSPGDSWTDERDFEIAPQTFKQTTTYTLAEAEAQPNLNTIQLESTLAVASGSSNAADAKIEIVEQSLDGQIQFDTAQGMFRQSRSRTLIKTRAPYRDMEIQTTVQSQLEITLEKKSE